MTTAITRIRVDPGFSDTDPTVVTLTLAGPLPVQAHEVAKIIAGAPTASTDVDTTGIGMAFAEHIEQSLNRLASPR